LMGNFLVNYWHVFVWFFVLLFFYCLVWIINGRGFFVNLYLCI
jgi:hypothetical protein